MCRRGPAVPSSPYGLCARKATLKNETSQFRWSRQSAAERQACSSAGTCTRHRLKRSQYLTDLSTLVGNKLVVRKGTGVSRPVTHDSYTVETYLDGSYSFICIWRDEWPERDWLNRRTLRCWCGHRLARCPQLLWHTVRAIASVSFHV